MSIDILEIPIDYDDSVFYSKGKQDQRRWVAELDTELKCLGCDPLKLHPDGVIYGRSRCNVSGFWSEYDYLIMPWGDYGQRGSFDITSHEHFRYFSNHDGTLLKGEK